MKKALIFFTFAFCIFTFDFAKAQSPQGTSYQAVIRNSSGVLISNRTVTLRFSIHDSAAAGPVVYQETQTPVTTAQGLVNCNVGMGSPVSALFSNINWGNKSKFLQVELDVNGGTAYTDMGTTQLMSVPYSLYANASNTANTAIRATKADTALYAANTMPSGNANGDILYWNGTSWVKLPIGNYGQTLSACDGVLTWGGCAPKVTTNTTSAISYTTATSGGNVTAEGGASVTARGVCWSTSTNPTIALATKTVDGTGTGAFTSSITGLAANTTYYVRAYATNSVGTSYGTQVSFVNFPSVTIGTQIWSSKNLDLRTYRNGDVIPQVTDSTEWANLTTGAWCWYNNDSATYAATYGRLYNWHAVNDPRGLAPQGWHVPTDAEWNRLTKFIDPSADTTQCCSNVAGTAMKSTTGWNNSGNGTDSSGLVGLPGGGRYDNGTFYVVGGYGNWWSARQYDATNAWYRYLYDYSSTLNRNYYDKTYGFSVRVVRD
jgi:uncharacterized protein (TIGR02145 family)